MKPNNTRRAVIVGIFILLGLVILIAGVLTLGGQNKTFEKKITVKAIFDDVGGLQAGNNVWFSGVKIGTVRHIRFSGSSQVEVEMRIDEKSQPYIRSNAKARISSESLIGNKIVVIYGGTEKSAPVQDGAQLGVEKALNTDEIMATLQENNRNLLAITKDFKTISGQLVGGKGSIGRLLSDEILFNTLQATAATLQRTSANAQQLTANLSAYVSRLQTKGSLTNDLVTDTVIFGRLRSATAQIDAAARQATTITANLATASANINNPATPIGTLLYDQQTAASIKATLKNLQGGTEKFDENMQALQHNFLLRGFFKKKAKQEAKEGKDTLVIISQ